MTSLSAEARRALIELQRAPRAADGGFVMGARLFEVCVELGWVDRPKSDMPMVSRVTPCLSPVNARAVLTRELGDWEFRVQQDAAAAEASAVV
jgi:hypothetical protein